MATSASTVDSRALGAHAHFARESPWRRRAARWLIPALIAVVVLAENHTHLGERSWSARGYPQNSVTVDGELVQYEWRLHLGPTRWVSGEPLPPYTDGFTIYRWFGSYLHALGWAVTGGAVTGLVLFSDAMWLIAAWSTMTLAERATNSERMGAAAGLLVATSGGFLALQWRTPHLAAAACVPLVWLLAEARPLDAWTVPRRAAVLGLLLAVAGLTYELHAALVPWLLLTTLPQAFTQAGSRGAELLRVAVAACSFAVVYGAWRWMAQNVLFESIHASAGNEALPAARAVLTQMQALGPAAALLPRLTSLARVAPFTFAPPALVFAGAGLVGLPRRWMWSAASLAAIFGASAMLTKGELQVLFLGFPGLYVLSAGGVQWLGRVLTRILRRGGDGRDIELGLAVVLVAASWVLTHRELWGDYDLLRAW